jgi:hypothetical protein
VVGAVEIVRSLLTVEGAGPVAGGVEGESSRDHLKTSAHQFGEIVATDRDVGECGVWKS